MESNKYIDEKLQDHEIFLDNLPRKNGNNNKIDWKSSIGYKVPFIYDDIKGEVEIVDYNPKNQKLTIKYKDEVFKDKPIHTGNFSKCKISFYLKVRTKDFKYEIGTYFKDDKRDLIITDREYRVDKSGITRKHYKYTCNRCGWTKGWATEYNLKLGRGCACCANKTAVLGINTIWDTDPWMMRWISEKDAKGYTRCSGQKIEVICPDCGKKKKMQISKINNYRHITCTCRDNISYPEKFMISLLNQLNIKYIHQLSKSTFKWCDKYRYDFYIPNLNMIIETHGKQHYESCGWCKYDDIAKNDTAKKILAIDNNVKYYITINCSLSDMNFIKNEILTSKLTELLDLSKVDWEECEKTALTSLVRLACEIHNNNPNYTTGDIGEIMGYNYSTIKSWLILGSNHGLTYYDAVESKANANRKIQRNRQRKEVII